MAESGSENRQRQVKRTVRLTTIEDALLRTHAELAGVSVASYLRTAALNMPPPRAARRPTSSHEDVAQLIGQLGRLATAFRDATSTEAQALADAQAVETAMRDLSELRLLCFESLGRTP